MEMKIEEREKNSEVGWKTERITGKEESWKGRMRRNEEKEWNGKNDEDGGEGEKERGE